MENKETLASALCKAQSEFLPAAQSGYNPHFKSSFSTMTDLIRATRASLKKYNISVTQYPDVREGIMGLVTEVLFHQEKISSFTPINLDKPSDMQAFGKACSYATRYVYKMMLGIEAADEDDDGNESAGVVQHNSGLATVKQVHFLRQLLVGRDEVKAKLLEAYKVDVLEKLTFEQASKAIEMIKGK